MKQRAKGNESARPHSVLAMDTSVGFGRGNGGHQGGRGRRRFGQGGRGILPTPNISGVL